jgi:hypothetical protein
MATLAEIRAKLQQQSAGKSSGTVGDNAIYPHWNIKEGQEAVVRFLPDKDPNNTFFWTERAMIKLPFAGVKGETSSGPVQVQVPCVEMWNETCPILSEVRTWFKDKSMEAMGRKYWKKRSYIFQGFVIQNPLTDDQAPENPIRRFIIGPQIFQIIRSALLDPEMENLPTDLNNGVDFRITKTSKGGYADYSTSKWSRRERALSEEERSAIDSHGLYDLGSFRPKKPTETELTIMKQMFEDSVNGEAYDPQKYGQYFKPSGMTTGTTATQFNTSPAQPSATEVVQEVAQPVVAETVSVNTTQPSSQPTAQAGAESSSSRAEDILKLIRSRQKAQ